MTTLMFQERFAPLVTSGTKRQTIRPRRKKPIKVGDQLSLRKWSGKAYRSPQVVLLDAVCTRTANVEIGEWEILIDGQVLRPDQKQSLAQADGFKDAAEMITWFAATHDLPFVGTLIVWDPYIKSFDCNAGDHSDACPAGKDAKP